MGLVDQLIWVRRFARLLYDNSPWISLLPGSRERNLRTFRFECLLWLSRPRAILSIEILGARCRVVLPYLGESELQIVSLVYWTKGLTNCTSVIKFFPMFGEATNRIDNEFIRSIRVYVETM